MERAGQIERGVGLGLLGPGFAVADVVGSPRAEVVGVVMLTGVLSGEGVRLPPVNPLTVTILHLHVVDPDARLIVLPLPGGGEGGGIGDLRQRVDGGGGRLAGRLCLNHNERVATDDVVILIRGKPIRGSARQGEGIGITSCSRGLGNTPTVHQRGRGHRRRKRVDAGGGTLIPQHADLASRRAPQRDIQIRITDNSSGEGWGNQVRSGDLVGNVGRAEGVVVAN